ncbi:uncharacterized protein LOC118157537 [Oxyura jamaicensis]|uniref:uncharacterized protein LOC118157531 n=1 Tax=Oxyura jamaicensis TaxID=8884 RepID=UPI0015A5002C|nr:uncharacterized protein LOC118157531 [Oxyura jamaicensis]XP_035167815.1 uncharacterized protein LOC118157537 [Oxyura jamaicensis]
MFICVSPPPEAGAQRGRQIHFKNKRFPKQCWGGGGCCEAARSREERCFILLLPGSALSRAAQHSSPLVNAVPSQAVPLAPLSLPVAVWGHEQPLKAVRVCSWGSCGWPQCWAEEGGVFLKTYNVSLCCSPSREHQAGRSRSPGLTVQSCLRRDPGLCRRCKDVPVPPPDRRSAAESPCGGRKTQAKGKWNCCNSSLETGWLSGGPCLRWASCCGCGAPRPVSCSWHESRACSTLVGSNLEGVFHCQGWGWMQAATVMQQTRRVKQGAKPRAFSSWFQGGNPPSSLPPSEEKTPGREQRPQSQRAGTEASSGPEPQHRKRKQRPCGGDSYMPSEGGRQSQGQKGWVPPGQQGLSRPLGQIQQGEHGALLRVRMYAGGR